VTAMGTPTFAKSSTGTPINAAETNEYGLLAAYSALGLTNQLYAIRADIDLNQLTGTSVRPDSTPADQTYWLNTGSTDFGVFTLQATASGTTAFGSVTPIIITDPSQVFNDSNFAYDVPTPQKWVGQTGSYAITAIDSVTGLPPSTLRLFYKTNIGATGVYSSSTPWVQVGSTNWQYSLPVVRGTIPSATGMAINNTLTVNGITVTLTTANTIAQLVTNINSAGITGVKAGQDTSGNLLFFVSSASISTQGGGGSTADGKMILQDGTGTPLKFCGINLSGATSYYCPILFYGNYAQQPSGGWLATDSQPRPAGSIWFKTTSTGGGWSPSLSQWNAGTSQWVSQNTPLFGPDNSGSVPSCLAQAVYNLDTTGGGINIAAGTVVGVYGVQDTTSNNLQFYSRYNTGITVGTSQVPTTGFTPTFTAGNQYILNASAPGSTTMTPYTITTSGTTNTSFVYDILNANIPYVTAQVNANGSISITHTTGGEIYITQTSGTPLISAGFTNNSSPTVEVNKLNQIVIDNWMPITSEVVYQSNTPYSAPSTGTYWYYSNPSDVDIMINNGSQWVGYQNGGIDARGYTLSNTDKNGVIYSAGTAPTYQSNGTTRVVAGDLWLDTGDLANYPSLYRYTGSAWVAIDNTDHVTSNGIIFADARWDTTGTTDIITGAFPAISDGVSVGLLFSNYVDLDVVDPRLYPRGTLLFNTRRSGYNIKKYVAGYFNSTTYPTLPTGVPGTPGSLPTITASWVTASGLNSHGAMNAGSAAQRALVVAALQSAIDSNTDAIESIYNFNLLCAPGYPEVLSNLINLNNNRANTGFVIGDTPLTLAPNSIDITNWVNNSTGNGLSTVAQSDPYTGIYYPAGQTNDLAGDTVVVPASHAVLRTFLHNDQVAYPWFAPAGVNRGLISNLNDIGYVNSATGAFVHNGINQGLRDALYPLKINPLTQLPGSGLVIWGQQTRYAGTSARNSINVVRLENYLRNIFASISNGYLFEPNDQITRSSIARVIEGALNNVLSLRGLYDFLVICDTSNNTSTTIANQQLYVDVAIEPLRDVEFIYIPIAIYNPGVISKLGTSSTV
jgi:Phage tail sheath C-terminal domain